METVSDKLLEHAPAIDGTDWDMNQQCRDNRAGPTILGKPCHIWADPFVTGVRWPAGLNESRLAHIHAHHGGMPREPSGLHESNQIESCELRTIR